MQHEKESKHDARQGKESRQHERCNASRAGGKRKARACALSTAALSSSSCFFWYRGARLRVSRSCGGAASWQQEGAHRPGLEPG